MSISPEISHAELPPTDGIEVVSFDIWMTLIRSNRDHKRAQADLIAKRWDVIDPNFVTVMKEEDRATDSETDQTGHQYGPEHRLSRIANRVGRIVSSNEIDRLTVEVQDLFLDYPVRLLEDDLLSSLDRVRAAGLRTALVSNTGFINGDHMRRALDTAGILERMDTVIFSNEVGAAKPDPRIYERLSQNTGVDYGRILHVGDNYRTDYLGPTALGIHAVHLATETEAVYHVPSIAALAKDLTESA